MTQTLEARVAELEHQLGLQQDIHAVRRLQYSYGYFIDKSQYDEVVDLFDGKNNQIDVSKVDVSMDGIELEDREFIKAIQEKREPNGSLQQLLPCMHVLGKLEKIIDPQRKAHA